MGCRGPQTYNSCGIMRWNNGTSYPIQSGAPCIGCSETGFWDNAPLYNQLAAFPGFGIESTADTIGAALAVGAAGGVAVHAILTNIRKRRQIKEELGKSLRDKDVQNDEGEE